MEERRKSKRMPIRLSLEISDLYKQAVKVANAPIEVLNKNRDWLQVSKLPIGYYFNASTNLGDKSTA